MREGLSTVIVGKPNVGKSSMLNNLIQDNKAIVTEVAGTTRDVLEEYVNVRGVPLRLVDTAVFVTLKISLKKLVSNVHVKP